jgi:hypothetical protein
MGTESLGYAGKRKAKYRMGRAYATGEEEKGETLREAKDTKVFHIWLMQSNA